jgi:hypothetical protein
MTQRIVTLEIKFDRTFTLEQAETLKDALWVFFEEYDANMGVELNKTVDFVICDQK